MLVCNVISRPRGVAIAGDIVETAIASDANTTGNIVFAALVDAPASVTDRIDAYFGQVMAEQANAIDTYSVGMLHAAFVNEPAVARDALIPRGPSVFIADVVEVVTAVDEPGVDVPLVALTALVAGGIGPVVVVGGPSRQANANGVMVNL